MQHFPDCPWSKEKPARGVCTCDRNPQVMVLNSPYGYFTTPLGERIPNGTVCEVDGWGNTFPGPRAKFPGHAHTMAVPSHWFTRRP